jgi:hypothetical protein
MANRDLFRDGDAPEAVGDGTGRNSLAGDLQAVRSSLDSLTTDLRALWSSALVGGDDVDLERLTAASHAVHRAAMALDQSTLAAVTAMDDHRSDHGEALHDAPTPR